MNESLQHLVWDAQNWAETAFVRGVRRLTHRYRLWERWFCLDCHEHTVLEYYMVQDALWLESGGGSGMLCIRCLEGRLERTLEPEDFTDAPINGPDRVRSARLRDRLGWFESFPV